MLYLYWTCCILIYFNLLAIEKFISDTSMIIILNIIQGVLICLLLKCTCKLEKGIAILAALFTLVQIVYLWVRISPEMYFHESLYFLPVLIGVDIYIFIYLLFKERKYIKAMLSGE